MTDENPPDEFDASQIIKAAGDAVNSDKCVLEKGLDETAQRLRSTLGAVSGGYGAQGPSPEQIEHLRQQKMAQAAMDGTQFPSQWQGSLNSSPHMLPEVQLRAQCISSALTLGVREPAKIIETAQAFYNFIVGAKPAATLHTVPRE